MNTQMDGTKLDGGTIMPAHWIQRFIWFVAFLASGLLVFVVFGHYFPTFKGTADTIGRVFVAAAFLVMAIIARQREGLRKHWLIPFAFFTALTAISIDYTLGLSKWILPALGLSIKSPAGLAIDKLESSLLGIVTVLTLNGLAGQGVDSLYIRRGNLKLGLIVGLLAFGLMAAFVIPVTEWFFKGENLTWARILPWMPWVLIMVFSNAAYEELVFRGLFIGKMSPFLGRFAINLVTTIPFVLNHAGNNYMSNAFIFFVLQLLPLSLVWCWLMQKTSSLWGSILFHAAMDIPVFVGIFSTL
jgi:membrane protease YdiL (CAAX protease family)